MIATLLCKSILRDLNKQHYDCDAIIRHCIFFPFKLFQEKATESLQKS